MAADNEFQNVEIVLGGSQLDVMLLQMNHEVNANNASEYNFMGNPIQEIAEDVWAVPAYLSEEYSIFFLYTTSEEGDWLLAFSEAEMDDGQFNLSEPIVTGEGINRLYKHNEDRAKMVLKFVNDIEKAGEGTWRMVED